MTDWSDDDSQTREVNLLLEELVALGLGDDWATIRTAVRAVVAERDRLQVVVKDRAREQLQTEVLAHTKTARERDRLRAVGEAYVAAVEDTAGDVGRMVDEGKVRALQERGGKLATAFAALKSALDISGVMGRETEEVIEGDLGQRVGAALSGLAREAGLKQRPVAEQVGVDQTMVSAWWRGTSIPTLPRLIALAEALGTTLETILRRAGLLDGTGIVGEEDEHGDVAGTGEGGHHGVRDGGVPGADGGARDPASVHPPQDQPLGDESSAGGVVPPVHGRGDRDPLPVFPKEHDGVEPSPEDDDDRRDTRGRP